MVLTITYIELKSPFKYFALSLNALKIMKQLKDYKVTLKSTGFWKKHYTMTFWESADDMRKFAVSGAHLEAMRQSAKIGKEIRTLTIEAPSFPSWDEAKKKVINTGKIINLSSR